MDTLDGNELMANIMKSCVNMEHPFCIVSKANGRLTVLISV